MTTNLDEAPDDLMERRLRTACHAVIPHLMGGEVPVDSELLDDVPDAVVVPLHVAGRPATPPRVRWLTLAASMVLIAGAFTGWSVWTHRDPAAPAGTAPVDTAATVDTGAPVRTVALTPSIASTLVPIAPPATALTCDDYGCHGFDPLPVEPGASDYYEGPASLGVPVVDLSMFDNLTRCARLTTDFSACAQLEGIAGVNLVRYSTALTVDTSNRNLASFDVSIGTTFTDLAPGDYASGWNQGDSPMATAEVRAHAALRFSHGGSPAVVWQERPGVLAWVAVPPEQADQLMAIAEGVRRVDGPTTIPYRVVALPSALPWPAVSNDGRGVIVGRLGSHECVGVDYIDHCGVSIADLTFIVPRPGGLVALGGSAPPEVAGVHIEFDAHPADGVTAYPRSFANFTSHLWEIETAATSQSITVTWLDAAGAVLATHRVELNLSALGRG